MSRAYGAEKEVPAGLVPLLDVPGLGGKKLSRLYHELGVVDKDTLLQEAENGHIEALKGFGKKSAEKMAEAVREMGERPDRYPLNDVLPIIKKVELIYPKLLQSKGSRKLGVYGDCAKQ